MVTFLVSAFVVFKVQVEIPLEFVTGQVESVFADPLTVKRGVTPTTGLLEASKRVIDTVAGCELSATKGPELIVKVD